MKKDVTADFYHTYPHMCRDGHPEIGFATDMEQCPVCTVRGLLQELADYFADYPIENHGHPVEDSRSCQECFFLAALRQALGLP